MTKLKLAVAAAIASSAVASLPAMATCDDLGKNLAGAAALSNVAKASSATPFTNLTGAVKSAARAATGGYGLPMWVTLVDESGTVCAVATTPSEAPVAAFASSGALSQTNGGAAQWGLTMSDATSTNPWSSSYTGTNKSGKVAKAADSNANAKGAADVQWLASRVISAQKAFTATSLSVNGYAISSANLYTAVKEGNSLFGLQHSNPVDASRAYATGKAASSFGTKTDPLVKQRIGGINVFGGGLALYAGGKKVGAVGVSGDTSCRDHAFAWEVRNALNLAPSTGTSGITNYNVLVSASGTAATNGLATGLKGDEMIIDKTGTGLSATASVVTTDQTYWLNNWKHPNCVNMVPHGSMLVF